MKRIMKKPLKIVLIVLGILFGIFKILGQTNMLKMYNISTNANEPGLKLNSKIFVSNLMNHENGDFICYKYEDEMLGKHIRTHRLLGKSNDIIEIKNRILYINEVNVDAEMELKHFYVIETSEFQKLLSEKQIEKEEMAYRTKDKVIVSLLDKVAKQNGLSEKIKLEPKKKTDKIIREVYNKDWNIDNFGPLKIPSGKCFVIGDNRHNSEDSRYIGLINESDIVGTVVKK